MIKRPSEVINTLISTTKLRYFSSAFLLCILGACGGSGAGDSGAGDNMGTPDNSAAMAIEPLVGVWDLPDNWRGEDNDEAYMLIKTADAAGIAEVIVYDFDDATTGLGRNCYFVEGLPGTVTQSLSNELFMDVSSFPDAVVSLNSIGELVINYFDTPPSGGERVTTTLIAQRINITETDITPLCPS